VLPQVDHLKAVASQQVRDGHRADLVLIEPRVPTTMRPDVHHAGSSGEGVARLTVALTQHEGDLAGRGIGIERATIGA